MLERLTPEQDPRDPTVKPSWKSIETWVALAVLVLDTLQAQGMFDLSHPANIGLHVLAVAYVVARTWLKVAGVQSAAQVAAAEVTPAPQVIAGEVLSTELKP